MWLRTPKTLVTNWYEHLATKKYQLRSLSLLPLMITKDLFDISLIVFAYTASLNLRKVLDSEHNWKHPL